MRKKYRIWLQRALDSQFYKTPHGSDKIKEAKNIYFANNACFMTMKRNGEYETYHKFKIPVETEIDWSREVKKLLVTDILKGNKLYKVVALSNINMAQNEIVESFRMLAESPLKKEIYAEVIKQKKLIQEEIYLKILACFEQPTKQQH